ncbi:MAG: MgtC/SapB family protein, partial [Deltaproteobacteria bacterium]|nr:MgtC/SapB family protein [Deltaproteobacteria bacterium]
MPPSVTDLAVWGEYLLKLFVAMVLSGIIGVERQLRRKTAGMRTHMLVCLGSLIFTLLGMDLFTREVTGFTAADST